jgi:hypothetical protein
LNFNVFKLLPFKQMMKIRIKSTVAFEKIFDFTEDPIQVTRNRIRIQQSLDSEEKNKELLIKQLEKYCNGIDRLFFELVRKHQLPLKSIPFFSWQIGSESICSSCWKVEQIVPKVLLAQLYLDSGHASLPDYKSASTNFAKAMQTHAHIKEHLLNWKWRNSDLNYPIFQLDWHNSCIAHLQCLQHMAMLSVGIDQNLPSETLFKVAERAVKSSVLSIANWTSGDEPENTLPACQAMQMYYSSKLLWKDGKYGNSIYRLQELNSSKITGLCVKTRFDAINTEIEKVGLLLSENTRINNGAYFDTVEIGEPLQTPAELIECDNYKYSGLKNVFFSERARAGPAGP